MENLTKIKIIINYPKKINFSKILAEIKIFTKILLKSKFFEIIEIFRKFPPNSKYFENLNKMEVFRSCQKNGNFSKIWFKIKFFPKNFNQTKLFKSPPKSNFFENLTLIEIFESLQNMKFFLIWTKIHFFSKIVLNRNLSKFKKKSQFFEIFHKHRNFKNIWIEIEFFFSQI